MVGGKRGRRREEEEKKKRRGLKPPRATGEEEEEEGRKANMREADEKGEGGREGEGGQKLQLALAAHLSTQEEREREEARSLRVIEEEGRKKNAPSQLHCQLARLIWLWAQQAKRMHSKNFAFFSSSPFFSLLHPFSKKEAGWQEVEKTLGRCTLAS